MQATDLRQVIKNFELTALKADSELYVDVDKARTGSNQASKVKLMKRELNYCYQDNQGGIDEYTYSRLLFVGHRGCGKTTELHRLEKELDSQYRIFPLENLEQKQSRIGTQEDFLYYIVEQIVEQCSKDVDLRIETENQIEALQKHLEQRIFGEQKEIIEEVHEKYADLEGQIGFSHHIVLTLLGKLGFKASYDETRKRQLNFNIRNYMQNFIEIANSILLTIQEVCRKQHKMPLLILDGLDKVSEKIAEEIFLGTQSFLASLACSMIVTFPLYLNYSTRYAEAIAPFGGNVFNLTTIPVNQMDGSEDPTGRGVLREIIEKRMDLEQVLEDPQNIDTVIANSGGNLRDLFTFIRSAALNADALDQEKIRTVDFEVAFQDKKNEIMRHLEARYKYALNRVYDGDGKATIVCETDDSNTLLDMFAAGLLIEYNGKRWVDLHPLLRQIMDEHGEKLWP